MSCCFSENALEEITFQFSLVLRGGLKDNLSFMLSSSLPYSWASASKHHNAVARNEGISLPYSALNVVWLLSVLGACRNPSRAVLL